jgi:uncharacterized protein YbbC (DUF1343 family)
MSRIDTGLQRWLRGDAEPVTAGARLGLLVHAASVEASARPILDCLRDAGTVRLERLFAPEHGLFGHEQDMERVRSTTEPVTGLPVISLYGASTDSLRPRAEDLAGLDAVIYDLQDVGSRYYTFVYTLSYVMEAARDADVAVVVLDRPNPLGGETLEGPVLDPDLASFVGRYPLPVRHGLTSGELARLFNDAFGIGCDLRVVEMRGWRRSMGFEDTRLPWVPPSPNMPTPATARVYPGGCLIEGTNLSEGRGTTTPFELVGAPWLEGRRLAVALRDEGLDGALFRPASFRPEFQKHAGQPCSGVQVLVEDRESFRPFATYLALIRQARRQAPESFAWRSEPYEFETSRPAIDLLLGRADLRPMLESGASVAEMRRLWEPGLREFRKARRPFLLYR